MEQQKIAQNTGISSPYYLLAKKHGFRFKDAERLYDERADKEQEIVDDIGERPKPVKIVLAFLCILIALIFAYIEALNVSTTIVGALGINETASIIIGFAFASSGLVCGDLLATSWIKDDFTGKKKPMPRFYIGLVFAIVYLLGQYWLASRSGVGTGEELQETVTTLKWFICGIALAELLFGMAYLSISLKLFTLFIARIRTTFTIKNMNRHSRKTEEAWQRYAFEGNGQPLQEEVPAIKEAREFYNNGGFNE